MLATGLAKRRDDRQDSCGELVAGLAAALGDEHAGGEPAAAAEPHAKLLVAAPEPGMRALVRASVKGRGLQVLEAADPASAVVIARREQPEVALVDWGMAERELRDEPEIAELKIVSMAAEGQADEGAPPDGADAWIQRPFSPLQLLHAIRRVADAQPVG